MLKNLKYQKNGSRRKSTLQQNGKVLIFDDESVNGKSQTASSLIWILRITSSF